MIKLAVFDLSGTLVNGSYLVSAASLMGNGKRVRDCLTAYFNGKISGEQLTESCALLEEGLSVNNDFLKIYEGMELSGGVMPTLEWLRQKGIKTAIVSAASQRFCKFIASKLGIDYAYGTRYEVKEGEFTGRIEKMYAKKEQVLQGLIERLGLKAEDCVAVGDSAVDVKMVKIAGIGIGFRPKPVLAKEADYNITDFREIISIINSTQA